MTTFRAIQAIFIAGWVVSGVLFVAGHSGVGDLGPTITSFVLYWLTWRCANCRGDTGFGSRSTVKLVLSREEKRARRDPATTLAILLSGLAALWMTAVLIITHGSQSWLTDAAMLAVLPIIAVVGSVSMRYTGRRARQ